MNSFQIKRNSDRSIHDQLIDGLSDYIKNAIPGSRIPSETAFCRNYGLARMTVSKALKQLEEQGLIHRRRGSGTYVNSQPIITYLLPSPDFLTSYELSTYPISEQMRGIIRATHELNIRMETLAASPTNNPDDISYDIFRHINSSSRVIVTPWFYKIFELLLERQAQVCLLHSQDLYSLPEKFYNITKNWIKQELDRKRATHALISHLYQLGCQRIALLSPWILSEKNHPVLETYCQRMREFGLPEIYYELPNKLDNWKLISEIYRTNKFDGLLVNAFCLNNIGESVNSLFRIPENIKVAFLNYNKPEMSYIPHFSYYYFDFDFIGYDSVRLLLEGNCNHVEIYKPIINIKNNYK
jgi:DNA-binding transcriptional regulator YhcF (GntR family)